MIKVAVTILILCIGKLIEILLAVAAFVLASTINASFIILV
jgi:hypothetical protein